MVDTIIAALALSVFLAFLVFLSYSIGSLDLWIVVLVVSMMAVADFVDELRRDDKGS